MEIEHDPVRRDGFFFDRQNFRRNLYRLICAFFASAEFARLGRASDADQVSELANEIQESEISRLLVTIAATARVIQDRDFRPGLAPHVCCGRFVPDLANPKAIEPLSLRDACNKIIHAKRFNFDVKPLPRSDRQLPNPAYVLRPVLHMYGKQDRANWKAELNIVEFVRANSSFMRG